MRTFCLISALMLAAIGQGQNEKAIFRGLHLLDGYSVKKQWTVDAEAWTIEGKRGFKIEFEEGPSEGSWADPAEQSKYSWFREQVIRGCRIRYAIVKPGVKTQWESSEHSGQRPGNILLVTFLLNGDRSDYTANFKAKIRSQDELADALLMIATFDPLRREH